ncbi:MAG: hypothetical protein IJ046_02765 [Clostridia bacterium]|nr:hypothetical protein [Clostridia bacterium]
MKKITALLLCIMLLAGALSSCNWKLFEPVESTEAETTASTPKADPDRLEDGAIILTSSENRKVFATDDGYIIYSFVGESVKSITKVYEFESVEAAKEYANDAASEAVKNGEQPRDLRLEGMLVIELIKFSTDRESLGFNYSKTRSEILESYANAGVETK